MKYDDFTPVILHEAQDKRLILRWLLLTVQDLEVVQAYIYIYMGLYFSSWL